MLGNNFLLWENDTFIVCTPFNPHLPYTDGPIVLVKPKANVATSWQQPKLTGLAFELAANICQIMESLHMTSSFNLQTNGNWGLLPDATQFFHIYIYGRNKTTSWGKPLVLPESPGTYHNDPMPESDRTKLKDVFMRSLTDISINI